jgi:hypothetical protein
MLALSGQCQLTPSSAEPFHLTNCTYKVPLCDDDGAWNKTLEAVQANYTLAILGSVLPESLVALLYKPDHLSTDCPIAVKSLACVQLFPRFARLWANGLHCVSFLLRL